MLDYISPTQLNMYLRCPAQYYFRYIEGIKVPPKSALTKGKAVHKGQEENYSQKIQTQQDIKLNELQEIVSAEFDTLATETEWMPDEDKGQIKDETISLASLYHKELAPQIQPILVEEEILIDIPDGKLKGYIDVVDSKGNIRDTKTTARTPNEDTIDKSLQLTAYAAAYRQLMDKEENSIIMDYLVSTKKPKIVTLQTVKTEEDIQRFYRTTSRVIKAIENNIFYPNEDNFMCNKINCGYWDLCHKTF